MFTSFINNHDKGSSRTNELVAAVRRATVLEKFLKKLIKNGSCLVYRRVPEKPQRGTPSMPPEVHQFGGVVQDEWC